MLKREGDYKKLLKKAYDYESKAFKQWDKSNFLNAADNFKESAKFFDKANKVAETLDNRILTASNMYVELSNYYWVLGLKKFTDDEKYSESSQFFKKAILNKKKALEIDKEDLPLRKGSADKSEVKRREWRVYQQSTLRELYAYYFLSKGLEAEAKHKLKIALENYENAIANYNQQIKYLKSVKKSYFLVKLYSLKTKLRIGECKKGLGKIKEAIKQYEEIIREIEAMDKRHRSRAESVLALTKAELAECYKELNELEKADKYYWDFMKWAKKVKLDDEQAGEVARCICIVAIINIQLNRPELIKKVVSEFKAGKIFGKKLQEIVKNPWYKLAKLIAEYTETEDKNILKEAMLVYNKMIDKKDRFVTNFFDSSFNT
ncbi:MAG: hypothetical protein ACTSYQ_00810 [Candidatus Odinarchaeia archaeon]